MAPAAGNRAAATRFVQPLPKSRWSRIEKPGSNGCMTKTRPISSLDEGQDVGVELVGLDLGQAMCPTLVNDELGVPYDLGRL
jgi:hypothetical protein